MEVTKLRLIVAFALLLSIAYSLNGQVRQETPVDTIKVGILFSTEGKMKLSEKPLIDATCLAIEEVNKRASKNGFYLKPVKRECNSTPEDFALKAKQLLDEKVVSIFGCWRSDCRKAVIRVLEESAAGAKPNLLWYPVQYEGGENNAYVIYTGATPAQQIFPAIDWAADKLKVKKIFLVGSPYVFPYEANKLIRHYSEDKKIEIVGEEYLPEESADFDRVMQIIASAKPDIILNTVNGDNNIGLFWKLSTIPRSDNTMIPVLSFSLAEQELWHIGTRFTSGNYASWTYFQSLDTEANIEFRKKFIQPLKKNHVTSDPIQTAYSQVLLFEKTVLGIPDRRYTFDNIKKSARNAIAAGPSGTFRLDGHYHAFRPFLVGRINDQKQFEIEAGNPDRLIPPDPYYPQDFFTEERKKERKEREDHSRQLESLRKEDKKDEFKSKLFQLLRANEEEFVELGIINVPDNDEAYAEDILRLASANGKHSVFIVQTALDKTSSNPPKTAKMLRVIELALNSPTPGIRYRGCQLLKLAITQDYNGNTDNNLSELEDLFNKADEGENPFFRNDTNRKQLGTMLETLKNRQTWFDRLMSLDGQSIFYIMVALLIVCFYPLLYFFMRMSPLKFISFFDLHARFAKADTEEPKGIVAKLFKGLYLDKHVIKAWEDEYRQPLRDMFAKNKEVADRSTFIPIQVSYEIGREIRNTVFSGNKNSNEIRTLADSSFPVLVYGEGGLGKTSLACQLAQLNDYTPIFLEAPKLEALYGKLVISTQELSKWVHDELARTNLGGKKKLVSSPYFLQKVLAQSKLLVIIDDISSAKEPKGTATINANIIFTSRFNSVEGIFPNLKIRPQKVTDYEGFFKELLDKKYGVAFESNIFNQHIYNLNQLTGNALKDKGMNALFIVIYCDTIVRTAGLDRAGIETFPQLVEEYIRVINRNHNDRFSDQKVQSSLQAIAAKMCDRNLYPASIQVDTLKEVDEAMLEHLELSLGFLNISQSSWITFSLDPIAEYCAAMQMCLKFQPNDWRTLIGRFKAIPEKERGYGLLKAISEVLQEKRYDDLTWIRAEIKALQSAYYASIYNEVRIGILHAMHGALSISERSLVDAVRMAVEEVNEKSLAGSKRLKEFSVDFVYDEDQFAEIAREMISVHGVQSIFGCWTSSSRLKVKPVVEELDNLLWYPVQYEGGEGYDEKHNPTTKKSIVYGGAIPNQQIIPALDYFVKKEQRTKIFFVGSDYIFPHEAARIVSEYLKENGLALVQKPEFVSLQDEDFLDVIGKIKASGANLVFNTLNGRGNMAFFKAFKENGLDPKDIPVLSVSIAEDEILAIEPHYVQGHYCAWSYFQSLDNAANADFVNRFKEHNGRKPGYG